MEGLLQDWLSRTDDPFDTGERLPGTGMLDLGQCFSHVNIYQQAPPAYAAIITKYRQPLI